MSVIVSRAAAGAIGLLLLSCGASDTNAVVGGASTDSKGEAGDILAATDTDTAGETVAATDTETVAGTDTETVAATDTETVVATDTAATADTDVGLSGAPWSQLGDGPWLIGWAGGLNHFSWVRFGAGKSGGVAWYNPGKNLGANAPFWPCEGQGSWTLANKPQTVQLVFPASCDNQGFTITYTKIAKAKSGWPKGAVAEATVALHNFNSGQTQESMMAMQFPAEVCDAALSLCDDVLSN